MGIPFVHAVALAIGIVANAAANVLIKAAMRREAEGSGIGASLLSLARSPWFLAGVAVFGLALICYAHALRRVDLAVGYPVMTGVGMVLVAAASAWWFGEPVTLMRVMGMTCILVGAVLLVSSQGAGQKSEVSSGTPTVEGFPVDAPEGERRSSQGPGGTPSGPRSP